MKKLRFLVVFVAMLLILAMFLASCQKQQADDILSQTTSSKITSSNADTSKPQKNESASKPIISSKPEISSNTEVETSSEPKTNVSIEIPAPLPSPSSDPTPTPVSDAKRIIGKWEGMLDISKSLAKEGFEVSSPANVKIIYEFITTNSIIIKTDEMSYKNTMTPYFEIILRNNISQRFGITLEEFATQNNTTVQALVDASMEESVKSLTQTGTYKLEGKNLIITLTATGENDAYTYSFISDDKLSLTSDGETATFTKVR